MIENDELKARGLKQLRNAARNFWHMKYGTKTPMDVDSPLLRLADFLEYGTCYKNRTARMLRELATAIEVAKEPNAPRVD